MWREAIGPALVAIGIVGVVAFWPRRRSTIHPSAPQSLRELQARRAEIEQVAFCGTVARRRLEEIDARRHSKVTPFPKRAS